MSTMQRGSISIQHLTSWDTYLVAIRDLDNKVITVCKTNLLLSLVVRTELKLLFIHYQVVKWSILKVAGSLQPWQQSTLGCDQSWVKFKILAHNDSFFCQSPSALGINKRGVLRSLCCLFQCSLTGHSQSVREGGDSTLQYKVTQIWSFCSYVTQFCFFA